MTDKPVVRPYGSWISNLSAQRRKVAFTELELFFEQPESISNDLTSAGVRAALYLVGDQLFELGRQGDFHGLNLLDRAVSILPVGRRFANPPMATDPPEPQSPAERAARFRDY